MQANTLGAASRETSSSSLSSPEPASSPSQTQFVAKPFDRYLACAQISIGS